MNHRRFVVWATSLAAFLLPLWIIPHRWCERDSAAWFRGDEQLQSQLSRGLERLLTNQLTRSHFRTGSAQFNGEWLFGTYLMAGFGFGQTALEHPQWRARHLPLMELCIERILSNDLRAFDREMWGNDPLDTLDRDTGHDHAAYLGYFNLLLSLHRQLVPSSKYTALNDRITAALARRLERSPTMLLQSYPAETYPVDNAAVIASIASQHRALVEKWIARCRKDYLDPKTGLLIQAVEPHSGAAADSPRGSGTALAAYFLSFADPAFSCDLYQAACKHLADTFLGFGVVREYPRHCREGRGDIDSGPVILGYSISATGFLIAGSRIHGDPDEFARLTGTAHLFGAPLRRGVRREYVTGGPLGNAILFAMLTARRQSP
jgi:hypothetical protein